MQNPNDIVIIGGGIVGLATAYQLLTQNPNLRLTLIEKEKQVAKHQTGNNSGVIHSGIYYKPNSLKATNCKRGYDMLLDFCRKEEVNFDLCGKIIVATEKRELPALERIFERGQQNGLENITKINAEQIKEYEPHCTGIEGIFVPQTGIINYTDVAQKMAQRIQENGGQVQLGEKVVNIERKDGQAYLSTDKQTYSSKLIINCAGLYSDKMAQLAMDEKLNVKIIPFRGEYYKLKKDKEYLVKNLIYPVPDPAFPFLGVHFTRMMKGGVEAGPNAVLAYRREGYTKSAVHMGELWESLTWKGFQKVAFKYWKTGIGEVYRSYSKQAFTRALQKLIPEVQAQDLETGGAGVRAQACDKTGGLLDDFMILENEHAINVCNAPSPAATSSLSIGLTVAEKALKNHSF